MDYHRVIFDGGPNVAGTVFSQPRNLIRADSPRDIAPAFEQIEAARRAGLWLAGYASYELGYCFSRKLRHLLPERRAVPLMLFGVFDAPQPLGQVDCSTSRLRVRMSPPEPELSFADYHAAFDRVHDLIRAGDAYQVNLTFPMRAHSRDEPGALFDALARRHPVRHGALVELGWPAVVSLSPELFFRLSPDGVIETRPMKGTMARGKTEAEDAMLRARLACSQKDRAENLMIVDLLRNDISRVAQVGSVRVPELFEIETYATLHQMVSQVRGQVVPGTGLAALFAALFPCGSVTGAPKIRAMEIIAEVEPGPRDVYCGAIGWLAPDGAAEFNVAIRTMLMDDVGNIRLNVGGGVVYDSSAEAEYDEALLKARFARL
jgi:aminodeoxychorismate synthase component I